MRLALGSCSCLVTMAMVTVMSSIAFGITDNTGAMLAPRGAFNKEYLSSTIADVIADTANSSATLDTALIDLLDQVLTDKTRNEDDPDTSGLVKICCGTTVGGPVQVTCDCFNCETCYINNQVPIETCETLSTLVTHKDFFKVCLGSLSPTRSPTFEVPTPMPTFPDPYPQGMCPDGYYQTSILVVDGCGPVVGELDFWAAKASRGRAGDDSRQKLINLPLNIVNVTMNLTAEKDADLFLLEAVDSYNNACIVGFKCQYRQACDHLDGYHPCWPSKDGMEESVFFFSGDAEWSPTKPSTEVIRIKRVTWEGYYFAFLPVNSGKVNIKYSWNGVEPCTVPDYDQLVTDNCAVKPTRRPTRAPTSNAPTPAPPPTRAPTEAPTTKAPTRAPSEAPTTKAPTPTQAPSSTKAPTPKDYNPPASSSDIPAPAPPAPAPPAPPADDDSFGGWGDPHLTNIKGEHFELNSPGEHLLVQIPRGSGHDFQLHATVAQFNSRGGRKACKFFFTNFSMRGAWLGIDHDDKIDVWAGKGGSLDEFGLLYGKDRTLTHFRNLAKTQETTMLGGTLVEACGDDVNSESYSLCQRLGHKFRRNPKKVLLTLSSPKPVYLALSRYESADPAFLDISVDGLSAHRGDDVGGLLGNDDHSEVSSWPAGCGPKKPRN